MMKLLKDIWGHKHPLILVEDHKHLRDDDEEEEDDDHNNVHHDDGGGLKGRNCEACQEPIFIGPFYKCTECEFFLHKLCAELPQIMEHPKHPKHILTLRENQKGLGWFNRMLKSSWCVVCGNDIGQRFKYHCQECDAFYVDIICASNEGKIQHPSHRQHPLFRLRHPISSECYACGQKDEGIFYHCRTCSKVFIHQNCLSLPSSINHSSHDHPLKLKYSLPDQFSLSTNECDLCAKPIKSYLMHWVYCCAGCRYIAHVDCATSKTEPFMSILLPRRQNWMIRKLEDSSPDVIHLPVSDESVTLVSYLLKDISLQGENDDKLNHFGHDHPLILFDGQNPDTESCSAGKVCLSYNTNNDDDETLCEACVRPVLANTPFHRCTSAECNFFLHKCCADLPTEIQHPFHPEHPLILLPKSPKVFGLFLCKGCGYFCNGFSYSCRSCQDYYLDVTCAFLPRVVRYEAHPYRNLSLSEKTSRRCEVCHKTKSSIFGFSCDTCEFTIHARCALIPQTIKHIYDKHPFILTFSPVKDHPQDYFCEICEEEVDPKRGYFYHCGYCDQSIHISCLHPFDRESNIKFGGTFTSKNHPYPMTLIPVARDDTRNKRRLGQVIMYWGECNSCHSSLNEYYRVARFAFKCIPCSFVLCYECITK